MFCNIFVNGKASISICAWYQADNYGSRTHSYQQVTTALRGKIVMMVSEYGNSKFD
jgi:hypothetical protein